MLGHASSVVLNTLLCHHLSDCCRLCCQCCHKGRAANPGAEQLPGAHSRGSCAAAPAGTAGGTAERRLQGPAVGACPLPGLCRQRGAAVVAPTPRARQTQLCCCGRPGRAGRAGAAAPCSTPKNQCRATAHRDRPCGCRCFAAETGLQRDPACPMLHLLVVSRVSLRNRVAHFYYTAID